VGKVWARRRRGEGDTRITYLHYFLVSNLPSHPSRRVSKPLVTWLILIAGVVGAAAGAYVALALSGPHTAGVGLWLRDFAKTPGAAGVAAVIAAGLAFWGISRQVATSRANLEHEKLREQDRSWWQSFEWAVSRAVPLDRNHEALRLDVSIEVFNALLASAKARNSSAPTEVQQSACGGMLSILTSQIEKDKRDAGAPAVHSVVPSETTSIEQDARTQSALESYVRAAQGTPGESAGARARLFELQIVNAIRGFSDERIQVRDPRQVLRESGRDSFGYWPDGLVSVGGRDVYIETKYYSSASNAQLSHGIRQSLASIRGRGISDPMLVVTNQPPTNVDRFRQEFAAEVTVWEASNDNRALREALVRASELPPWRPGHSFGDGE
jgi:hypothetical protein